MGIIICGCKTRLKRQKKVPSELQNILDSKPVCFCTNCNAFAEPVVYRHNLWFTYFFVPVFRLQKGPALLCCSLCANELYVGSQDNICTGCGRWDQRTIGCCPCCGTRIQMTKMAPAS